MNNPRPRSRAGKKALITLCAIAAWVVVSVPIGRWSDTDPVPRPMWQAGSGEAVPEFFTYAMFPPKGGTPLLDAPDGAPIATVTRALANQHDELGSVFVHVRDGGAEGVVRLDALRWHAPADEAEAMVAELQAERRARGGEYEWYSCRVTLPETDVGEARLTVRTDSDETTWIYSLRGSEPPTPVRMERLHCVDAATQALPRLMLGFGLGVALLIVTLAVIVVTWIRR